MKRVLLITYDFPPAGGSGVQRATKFAKFLPRYGWKPVVLTTREGRVVARDPSLLADVVDTEVHRTLAPSYFPRKKSSSSSRFPRLGAWPRGGVGLDRFPFLSEEDRVGL